MEIPKTELLDTLMPWMVGLLLAEAAVVTWLWLMGRLRQPRVRFADSIASMLTGMFMQVSNLGLHAVMVGAFVAVGTYASLPVLLAGQAWGVPNPFPATAPGGGLFGWGFAIDGLAVLAWVGVYFAIDFAFYWFHRLAHTVNVFWATHVVHHSSEDYNLAVGFRHSAVENLVSGAFYLPLAFLGVPWQMFLVCYTLNLVYMFWVHTELVTKLPRWFEYVFSTPSHHRVHHARNPEYIDRNYGGTFIIWDRLFGTFCPEGHRPVYGITTPLRAFNPLTVNFHYYADMFRTLRRVRSVGDAIRYLFSPPGWFPSYLGGPQAVPPVSEATAPPKYTVPLGWGWAVYIAVQFAVLLGAVSVVLQYATSPEMRVDYLAFWSILLLSTMVALGGMLDRRPWAVAAEAARLLVVLGVSGAYLFDSPWPTAWVAGIFTGGALSALALAGLLGQRSGLWGHLGARG